MTGDGFACGQTPDYVKVTCWTAGVNQQTYQQYTHRFRDNPKWRMIQASDDDPPTFEAQQFETGRFGWFHAFTGESRTTS